MKNSKTETIGQLGEDSGWFDCVQHFSDQRSLSMARIVAAIFAMVIAKATVEYLMSRRPQEKDENHQVDDHAA